MSTNKESGCAKTIGVGAGLATIISACIALGAWLFPFDSIPSIFETNDYPTISPSINPTSTPCIWSFEDVRFESLKFFEDNGDFTNIEERVYAIRFSNQSARYINWELTLKSSCLAPQKENFMIEVTYYNPDGTIDGQYSVNSYFEEGWDWVTHANGWGNAEPGNWVVGRYKITLRVLGLAEISDYFYIEP